MALLRLKAIYEQDLFYTGSGFFRNGGGTMSSVVSRDIFVYPDFHCYFPDSLICVLQELCYFSFLGFQIIPFLQYIKQVVVFACVARLPPVYDVFNVFINVAGYYHSAFPGGVLRLCPDKPDHLTINRLNLQQAISLKLIPLHR
jgi:hypothetical protein